MAPAMAPAPPGHEGGAPGVREVGAGHGASTRPVAAAKAAPPWTLLARGVVIGGEHAEQGEVRHAGVDHGRHRRGGPVAVDPAAAVHDHQQRAPHAERRRVAARRLEGSADAGIPDTTSRRNSPHGIQPSPKRAMRSRVRSCRRPLIHSGTPPGCTGPRLAPHRGAGRLRRAVGRGPRQHGLAPPQPLQLAETRSSSPPRPAKGTPGAPYSSRAPADAHAEVDQPPDTTSSVATAFASAGARRSGATRIAVARRTRRVVAAMRSAA